MRIFNFKNSIKTKQYKSEKNLKNAKAPLLMTSVMNAVVCCQNPPQVHDLYLLSARMLAMECLQLGFLLEVAFDRRKPPAQSLSLKTLLI